MPPANPGPKVGATGRASGPSLHAADIYCESCGEVTPHRILRIEGGALPEPGAAIRGTARCRTCRLVHPFRSEPERRVELVQIVSDGGRSAPVRRSFAPDVHLQVGSNLPDVEPPARILKIDRHDGRSVRQGRAEDAATVWTSVVLGTRVPVSVVEGRRTRAARVEVDPSEPFEVGRPFDLNGLSYVVAALRARGRTWHDLGTVYEAREIERIYVRRMDAPPAGSNDWSNDLDIPSSPARSTSSRARSRSSPGTSTTRSRPRLRSADGGAADHRSAP